MQRYIKLFEEFALNEGKSKHPFGCSMVFVKYPELFKIQDSINPDDLHENGFEDEPHVTLLYGIHDGGDHKELDKDGLAEIINASKACLDEAIILKGITAFENEDFDVLKFDAEAPSLSEANKKLSEFPNSNSFPDYKPHVTIAYLKPGKAKEYIEKFKDIKDIEVEPEKIVYSRPNGTRLEEYAVEESLEVMEARLDIMDQYLDVLHESSLDEGLTIMDVISKIKGVFTTAKNMKDKAVKAFQKTKEDAKKSAETAAKMKEKSSKTTDKDQAKVYDERTKEEQAKLKLLTAKAKYEEAKVAVADAKTAVANAKMKKAASKK